MHLTSIDLAADARAWVAAGFAVDGAALTLGAVRDATARRRRRPRPAGLELRRSARRAAGRPAHPRSPPAPEPGGAHPNGVTAIDHVVAFSPDLERTVPALEAAGMDLRRRREGPTGAGSARQAFFRVGEAILEVVEHPPQAREAGDAEAPTRLWGLALLTPDMDATVDARAT